MSPGPDRRYHLTLTAAGRPTVHGWWGSEAVARDKFVAWVGVYGALPDAQVTLVDAETGAVLRECGRTRGAPVRHSAEEPRFGRPRTRGGSSNLP